MLHRAGIPWHATETSDLTMTEIKKPGIDELKKLIRTLAQSADDITNKVSFYIPPGKEFVDITRFLRDENNRGDPIVTGDDEKIIKTLKDLEAAPENGLVIFLDTVTSVVFEPPVPVSVYLYRRSTRFETGPLEDMLFSHDLVGLVVLDRHKASWGILDNGHVKPLGHLTSTVPPKHHKGGQSAARFQRLREIAVRDFYTRIGEHVSTAFLALDQFPERFGSLAVGGPGDAAAEFARGQFIRHDIATKILGVFEIASLGHDGLRQLADTARSVMKDKASSHRATVMETFQDELSKESGLAISGVETVKSHLLAGVVKTLLLSSSLRQAQRTVTCEICGHADTRTFALADSETVDSILAHTCRSCPDPVIIAPQQDMFDTLMDLARQTSAETIVIDDDSKDGKALSSLGGVGALLRFRV